MLPSKLNTANSAPRSLSVIRPTILLLDADAFSRRIIRALLEQDYAVLETGTLASAVDLYNKALPQVVILDPILGLEDGTKFLRHLQQRQDRLPIVIVLASDNSAEASEKALALGASAYLVKPFMPEHLILALKNHLWSQQHVEQTPERRVVNREIIGRIT